MSAAALLLAAGLSAAGAARGAPRAPAPTRAVVESDARVELLGVLQLLSGDALRARELPASAAGLEARYARWRGHPAVKSYAALAADPAKRARLLSLLFHLTPPPALAERPGAPPVPQEDADAVGGPAAERALLEQWRDFVRVTGFMDDFARRAAADARAAGAFRADVDSAAVARLEAYTGPLDSRLHLILSPVFRSGRFATIVPYPFAGGGVRVDGPFEVYELIEPERIENGEPVYARGSGWSELLDVAVDPVLGERCADVAALAGAQAGMGDGCSGEWFRCMTHFTIEAVLQRLDATGSPGRFAGVSFSSGPYGDAGRAVAHLLEDYERRRAEYPTLRALYPRLVETVAALPRGPAPSADEIRRMCGACRAAGGDATPPAPAEEPRGAEDFKRAGVALFLRGRAEEALADFRKAAALDAADPETRLDASVALARLGRGDDAAREADAAVALSRVAGESVLYADALLNRATVRGGGAARADLAAALAAAPADWPRRAEAESRLKAAAAR